MDKTSLLYAPFRSYGLICGDNQYIAHKLGDELFLTIPIKNYFVVYRTDKLVVCLVSKPAPGIITSLAVHNHDTYVSVGSSVYKYRRAHLVGRMMDFNSDICQIQVVGDVLVGYDNGNNFQILNIKSCTQGQLNLLHPAKICSVLHPSTYLNKFLIGYEDGHLELWNIRSCKLIYSFNSLQAFLRGSFQITSMIQSPACDVICIGFQSGDIFVFNIKLDLILFHFKQKGAVSSIAFRTDSLTSQFPYILTASNFGHIYIWMIEAESLSKKQLVKLHHTVMFAHSNAITKLEFLNTQPIFISSGSDNSLKMWIFDNPDGTPRLLRSRQGHSKYSRKLKFYGDVSSNALFKEEIYSNLQGLISADEDGRLLFVRTEKDYDFQELSQGNIVKKDLLSNSRLPPCLDFDFSYVGSKPWGDLVSIHEKTIDAYLWKVEDKSSMPISLKCPQELRGQGTFASSVVVTACGNFTLIGYSNGFVTKFNMQSGFVRGTFPTFSTEKHRDKDMLCVTGLFVDISNTNIVSINNGGYLQFRDFNNPHHLLAEEKLNASLDILSGSREHNFIITGDQYFVLRMYDLDTKKLCRIFYTNHTERISSLSFSLDNRRVLSSSLDGSLQVWDLSTTKLTFWVKFDSPICDFAIIPNGDLLITRKDRKEIEAFLDRSLVELINPTSEPQQPVFIDHFNGIDQDFQSSNDVLEDNYLSLLGEGGGSQGLTFSPLSKSYWTALCNQELIQTRKSIFKPTERIVIPFFIPSQNSQQPLIQQTHPSGSKIIKSQKVSVRSFLFQLLSSHSLKSGPDLLIYLMKLNPSQIDLEFRTLVSDIENPLESEILALNTLLSLLASLLQEDKNFEIIQAYVYRLITIYSDVFMVKKHCYEELNNLNRVIQSKSEKSQNLLQISICLVKNSLNIPLN